jgi:hypothetical protein
LIIPKIEINHHIDIEPVEKTNIFKDWRWNTIKLLKKYEWLSLVAYCDDLIMVNGSYIRNCKTWKERYSIWYWSTSFKWEIITENEAEKKVIDFLENNIFPEINNLNCYTNWQKTAISDFMYNSWKYTKHKITGKTFLSYVKNCNKNEVWWFIAPRLYTSKWLKKRRTWEWNFWVWIYKI